jgi:hypothetical protein
VGFVEQVRRSCMFQAYIPLLLGFHIPLTPLYFCCCPDAVWQGDHCLTGFASFMSQKTLCAYFVVTCAGLYCA